MSLKEDLLPVDLHPADLSDDQFIAAMEQLRISNANFHHRDHIRLAWAYFQNSDLPLAEQKISSCIHRFAAHNNAPRKYHHTITLAWMRIVAAATRLTPAIQTFEEFAAAHPFLFDPRLPWSFYSAASLSSDAARTAWVNPDLHPLP
jgi:hypothetical protein